jgi:NAD(P)-dependent dehydrogenase (short-subunit alcohol dehydrogenase family)
MSANNANARTIVVTGGGRGIGRAAVLLCAARGDKVAVLDKDGEAAESSAEDARNKGSGSAIALACDVTCEEQVAEAFRKVTLDLGAPYGLFANAGIDMGGFIHELPLTDWHTVLETNLTGIFLACKHGLQRMLAARSAASIVCTSSPTGFVALGGGASGAYSATKAGISALVRCMAIDYAPHGIRVNAIVPGATETTLMWSNVPAQDIPQMRMKVSSEIPLGRLAQPEDPARAVAWLLSEESAYVTGSHLVCDGGILAKASISV